MPLLQIKDLHLEFVSDRGRLRVLNGIDLSIGAGEIYGIVGETGCGKTVTGLSVLGLLPASAHVAEGQILYGDRDLLSLAPDQMRQVRGGEIAMIFQNPGSSLNPVFTVGSQMERVIKTHRAGSRALALEMLAAVGLADPERILRAYPHQLSGGMQQRVMIALALACRPRLLIADEPTTALDVTIQAQILALLRDLRDRFGISILLITHNLGVVAKTCDRLAVLYAGRVVETGSVRSVFERPEHPYTQGLMRAIPRPGLRGSQMTTIPGSVPADPGAVQGCAFAPRCPHVFDRCLQSEPPLYAAAAGGGAACFLLAEGEAT